MSQYQLFSNCSISADGTKLICDIVQNQQQCLKNCFQNIPTPPPSNNITTITWTGGDPVDGKAPYEKSIADYNFLCSVIPNTLEALSSNGNTSWYNYICNQHNDLLQRLSSSNRKYGLSFGGSNANIDTWYNMHNSIQQSMTGWVNFFASLKTQYNINFIDWDLEPFWTSDDPNSAANLQKFTQILESLLTLSYALKKNNFGISFTILPSLSYQAGVYFQECVIFQNRIKKLDDYRSYFDFIILMTYGSTQFVYGDTNSGGVGWSGFLEKNPQCYSSGYGSDFYALNYFAGFPMIIAVTLLKPYACYSDCIKSVVDLTKKYNDVKGIGFWAYGANAVDMDCTSSSPGNYSDGCKVMIAIDNYIRVLKSNTNPSSSDLFVADKYVPNLQVPWNSKGKVLSGNGCLSATISSNVKVDRKPRSNNGGYCNYF